MICRICSQRSSHRGSGCPQTRTGGDLAGADVGAHCLDCGDHGVRPGSHGQRDGDVLQIEASPAHAAPAARPAPQRLPFLGRGRPRRRHRPDSGWAPSRHQPRLAGSSGGTRTRSTVSIERRASRPRRRDQELSTRRRSTLRCRSLGRRDRGHRDHRPDHPPCLRRGRGHDRVRGRGASRIGVCDQCAPSRANAAPVVTRTRMRRPARQPSAQVFRPRRSLGSRAAGGSSGPAPCPAAAVSRISTRRGRATVSTQGPRPTRRIADVGPAVPPRLHSAR